MSYLPTPVPDGAASALRLRALCAGHEMSEWWRDSDDDDSAYGGIRQSTCGACDYYLWANEEGHIVITYGLQVAPPYTVPDCLNPLPLAEDARLRLLGHPEMFPAVVR